jgi:hypothetical protein
MDKTTAPKSAIGFLNGVNFCQKFAVGAAGREEYNLVVAVI